MSTTQPTLPANLGGPPPDIASLESIKSRVTQLIESIQTLAWQLEAFHPPPPWPDLLVKYAVVMAQTHNLSRILASSSTLASTALHPRAPLSDASLDGSLIPLLRNQQTTDVLRAESASVKRLSIALKLPEDPPPQLVLDTVSEVVAAHDARAERAQRAVAMLREKYDWHVRVAVDPDEVWNDEGDVDPHAAEEAPAAPHGPGSPAASANTSEEEEELENVLGPGIPNSDHEHEDIQMAEG
jgi:Mediator of RNA polymerase II transcription complex subunit 8